MALAHVLILIFTVLTVPDTFATVQRARQADTSDPWTWLTITTTISPCPYGPTFNPTAEGCYECTCGSTGYENCRCICGCDCAPCVDAAYITSRCCTTCPYGPCSDCYCDDEGQAQCMTISACACPPCVDEVVYPNDCCPSCPNGENCYAMGTIIPAGTDVQVNGYTCRCPDPSGFLFGRHERSVRKALGYDWPDGGCNQLEATCTMTTLPPSTTTTMPETTVAGCISSYDGQWYPPGSGMPSGSPCSDCYCDDEGQPLCMTISACACPPCVDEVVYPNDCCPSCPNGENCYAMGTIIPAGRDVQVNGYTCRCPDPSGFLFGRHERSVRKALRHDWPDGGCNQLEATCTQ
ncbi:PREDICTED: kielin/chordin-like protein [Branchiostoma belcheri]|uniref:Kielin/chordin-like protein n=1 Tax=Branchiostoma belcheri TaxID=7741 RepID=A0A6P5A4M6_BRABE|nr:PREDICTED: kielin/chordin-like protein [Branchiostoma belcheri]